MAEESIDSLVTPEKVGMDGRNASKTSDANSESLNNGRSRDIYHRRASIGSSNVGDSSTRNCSDKSDSANSGQNVLPHYLRASTGSCHDFCKYGRKHLLEEKARKPLRRRTPKVLPSEMHPVQIMVSGDRKKEKVVHEKPEKDTKNLSPDVNPSPDIKSNSRKLKTFLDKERSVKQQHLTETKNHSPELPSLRAKSDSQNPKESLDKEKIFKHKPSTDTKNHSPDQPFPGTKSHLQKPKTSLDAKTYSPKKILSGNKTSLPKYKPSSGQKFASPEPLEIVKNVFFPCKTVEDSVKQCSSTDNKISRAEKKTTYLPKQHSSAMKSKPVKLKPPPSSDNSDDTQGKGGRNSNEGTGRSMRASAVSIKKVSTKKVPAPTTATLTPKLSVIKTAYINPGRAGNLKLISLLKDRNRIHRAKTKTSDNHKVSEKSLHAIKMETKKIPVDSRLDYHAIPSLPSPLSAKSSSHGKTSSFSSHEEDNGSIEYSGGEAVEFIHDKNESLEIGKVLPVKENQKKSLRKSRMVVPEEKYCSPVKLKFRIGKVVDLQMDNSSPRRLRFRRAKVVGAEGNKGDLRRTFRKAEVKDDANGAELSSEKVILKHQDVQEKKDAQGLFNNVIEETASKLVESRKSKVKALVGAFETVISLQETKPSLQAVG